MTLSVVNTKNACGLHWKVCVTEWERVSKGTKGACCYKKKKYKKINKDGKEEGKFCIGFGPVPNASIFPCSGRISNSSRDDYKGKRYPKTPLPPEMKNVGGKNANGRVSENNTDDYRETGDKPEHLPDIETTCGQDMEILEYLKGQVGQTANYCAIGGKSNCRWYAYYLYEQIKKNIIQSGQK